jgi:hypothetical protein
MGWSNFHLHEFGIKGCRYGDPELLQELDPGDAFEDLRIFNSTITMLSDILSTPRKRTFRYLYDFSDLWEHEITFEGNPPADLAVKYPVCLEGERACPPDDVGGISGFANFLEAMADCKHPNHENLVDWYGGKFLPEAFDPKQATRAIRRGPA